MRTKKTAFYLLAALLGGCIPSLYPLYTDETLIFDERLIGRWVGEEETWQFSKAGEKEYEARVLQEDKEACFEAHLVKLGGMMYLDIFPASNETLESLPEIYRAHLLPAHTFMRVDQIEPDLQLRWVNAGELLEKDPNLLKHEKIDDDRIVLTASTEDIQKFVVEHANDIVLDVTEFARREPLFGEKDIVFDANFVGRWKGEDGRVLDSTRSGYKAYNLTLTDGQETKNEYKARTVKVKGVMLLAVYLSEPSNNEKACGLHLIPDEFAVIDQIEPKLLVREVDYQEVCEMLKEGPASLEQEVAKRQYTFEGVRIEP
ncbi:MAG: hypothetical protein PVJ86_11070 [Phycisphaerales bacterium]|jgi:hypothetical protein